MEREDVEAYEPEEVEQQEQVEMVEFADAQHFEVRTITPQDWARVNVQDGKLAHWYRGNNFRLPRGDFDFLTETEFRQYILGDPRLRLVRVEAE